MNNILQSNNNVLQSNNESKEKQLFKHILPKNLFKHILPKRVNEPLPYYNKKPCNSKNKEDTIDDIQHVVEIDGETINHGLFFGEQDEKAFISIKREELLKKTCCV